MPTVPDEVREQVRRESEGVETPDLHRMPGGSRPGDRPGLRPSDRLRIQRALEIVAATGRPLASFHGARQSGTSCRTARLSRSSCAGAGRAAPADRPSLRPMMKAGALDEVRALAASAISTRCCPPCAPTGCRACWPVCAARSASRGGRAGGKGTRAAMPSASSRGSGTSLRIGHGSTPEAGFTRPRWRESMARPCP